jgi:hypothetical protein
MEAWRCSKAATIKGWRSTRAATGKAADVAATKTAAVTATVTGRPCYGTKRHGCDADY